MRSGAAAAGSEARSGPRAIRPLRDFLAAESASGLLLIGFAGLAMLWANSPWKAAYHSVWSTDLAFELGRWSLHLDAREFVNEALMTVFFFVVGLEIKRELTDEELRNPRQAALPIIGAIGGMILPAALFAALTVGHIGARGWAIPMATDIALSLGVLALLGSRVPAGAKLFLLALAIVDDIGAIVVIAVFYGTGVKWVPLLLALGAVLAVITMRRAKVFGIGPYLAIGVVLWLALHASGLHATLAGVGLGLLAPTRPFQAVDLIDVAALNDLSSVAAARETVQIARSTVSVVEWLEHRLHPITSYMVVPVFALANMGVSLSGSSLRAAVHSQVALAIIVGLIAGKTVGIAGFSWIAIRIGLAQLPDDLVVPDLMGIGAIAGIGFTVALFVTDLAFAGDAALQGVAKLAVLVASLLSAALGCIIITRRARSRPSPDGSHRTNRTK